MPAVNNLTNVAMQELKFQLQRISDIFHISRRGQDLGSRIKKRADDGRIPPRPDRGRFFRRSKAQTLRCLSLPILLLHFYFLFEILTSFLDTRP